MNFSKKSLIFFTFCSLVLGLWIGVNKVKAQEEQEPPPDPRVSKVVVTPGSTTKGVTTNYSVKITFTENIPAITAIQIMNYGECSSEGGGSGCRLDFSNASFSGLPATLQDKWMDNILLITTSAISAGTYNTTLFNVKNPSDNGAFQLAVSVIIEPPSGMMPQTHSNTFIIGKAVIKGQVLKPDQQTPLQGVWVELRTSDYSQHWGIDTDGEGYYYIFVDNLPAGEYILEAYPGPETPKTLLKPDPITVTWDGTHTITQNLIFKAAKKKITGKVTYKDGTPVTVAEVWTNNAAKEGGWQNTEVNNQGKYELYVSSGDWEVGLNAPWDPVNNRPKDIDWMYSEPPKRISFSKSDDVTETKIVNFVVQKTNAKIKGQAVKPDGTPLQGGWVDIRGSEGKGGGAPISRDDGTFTINVIAGSYTLMIWPDMQDPNSRNLYSPEIKVTVAKNQIKNLGKIKLLRKDAKIKGKVTLSNTGTPVAGLMIHAWMRDGMGWADTTTDSKGNFELSVFAGNWEINIEPRTESGEMYIYTKPPRQVQLSKNQTVTGVNFEVLKADSQIQVTFVDKNGRALSNVFGWAFARPQKGGFGPGAEFGGPIERGRATIPVLGGDTYEIGAFMPPEESDFSIDKFVKVSVKKNENKKVALTLLPNDSYIKIFLKDQYGKKVFSDSHEIEVFVFDEFFNWRPAKPELKDNSYIVSVRGDRKYTVGYWISKGGYLNPPPEPDPFLVPKNKTVTRILTVFKANAKVTGTLLDPDGKPVSFGFVGASNRMFMENKLQGDFDKGKIVESGTEVFNGKFSLDLVDGEYELFAGAPPELNYLPPEITQIILKPNQTLKVTLQFRKATATLKASVSIKGAKISQEEEDFGFCHAWSEEDGFSGAPVFNGLANIPLTEGEWYVGCDTQVGTNLYRSPEELVVINKAGTYTKTFELQKENFEIPSGVTVSFSSDQNKLVELPDGTTVNIPANALDTNSGNVTLIAKPEIRLYHTKDTKPINFAWDFEALDTQGQLVENFNSNVTICIPYDETLLSELGITEEEILPKYFDSQTNTWKLPLGVSQDTEANKACFQVNHFTEFALTAGATTATGTTGAPTEGKIILSPITGGPHIQVYDAHGKLLNSFFAYNSDLRGEFNALSADVNGDGVKEIVTSAGSGFGPQIRVFTENGTVLTQFWAYDSWFTGGVNITLADLNGDGTYEIITSPKTRGGAHVRIFQYNSSTGQFDVIANIWPYATSFRGGIMVAVGDTDGDGVTNEFVTVPTQGGGVHVQYYRYANGQVNWLGWLWAFDNFNGGVNIALADLDGDGQDELVTVPRSNLSPYLKVWELSEGEVTTPQDSVLVYDEGFKGGLNLVTGDTDGDGKEEIWVAPRQGGGPHIRGYDFGTDGKLHFRQGFFALDKEFHGGVNMMLIDLDSDNDQELILAPASRGKANIRIYGDRASSLKLWGAFWGYDGKYQGGVNLSGK